MLGDVNMKARGGLDAMLPRCFGMAMKLLLAVYSDSVIHRTPCFVVVTFVGI